MHAFLASRVRRSATEVPHAVRGHSRVAHGPMQRQGACACGGSCPRCAASGDGHALAPEMRHTMESRFGTRFGDVRIHDDMSAAHAAQAEHAHAFTLGSHIYFGAGRYAPHTAAGATRLAHELVHVQQQRTGAAHGDPAAAEQEARAVGPRIAGGAAARVTRSLAPTVQHDDAAPTPDAETQLHLDPELQSEMLQQYIRWWLGTTLVEGDAPTETGDAGGSLRPRLRLRADFFAPLPEDPLWLAPNAQDLFSPFATRRAPVGAGDSDAVTSIYRDRYRLALGLPDLRALAPKFLRPIIPLTWRRDIAGALTGATVNFALQRDYPTPLEIADRAYFNMTGVSTTIFTLPAIPFDFL